MQGFRWNLVTADNVRSWGEELACGRSDCRHQHEDAINVVNGKWDVIQACLSLDM